jgi:ketopantoate reductase
MSKAKSISNFVQKGTKITLFYAETAVLIKKLASLIRYFSSCGGRLSVDHEIRRTLWKPEIHSRVYNSLLLNMWK